MAIKSHIPEEEETGEEKKMENTKYAQQRWIGFLCNDPS